MITNPKVKFKALINPTKYFLMFKKSYFRLFNLADDFKLSIENIAQFHTKTKNVKPYCILFTARSGSTYLSEELYRTKTLGRPEEPFNLDIIEDALKLEKFTLDAYINGVLRPENLSLSTKKIFGFKINWPQLQELTGVLKLEDIFANDITWFKLTRKNIVAQAISLYIADQSNIFHSPDIKDKNISKSDSIEYDKAKIK